MHPSNNLKSLLNEYFQKGQRASVLSLDVNLDKILILD